MANTTEPTPHPLTPSDPDDLRGEQTPLYEFFHSSSKKKGISDRAVFEIMTQSPQGCARGWGVSEFKRACSVFGGNQVSGLRASIVGNVENHYWAPSHRAHSRGEHPQ